MSDLWVIKDVATGKVLHYFDEEFLANEKLAQLQDVILKRIFRSTDSLELLEYDPDEIEECKYCGEVIKVRGKWTWLIHREAYNATNGERCRRCKDYNRDKLITKFNDAMIEFLSSITITGGKKINDH